MATDSRIEPQWKLWAQLIRLPTSMTLVADVLTAVAITQCEFPLRSALLLLPISLAIYWAGMILNDWFDIEKDRQQRSSRPLASGAITLQQAAFAGWGLLTLALGGCLVALALWNPARIAVVLPCCFGVIVAVVLYDGPLKKTWLAPWLMGVCRGLHWLFAAQFVLAVGGETSDYATPVSFAIAATMTVYIAGVTWFARKEADRKPSKLLLVFGATLMVAALAAHASMPNWLTFWAPEIKPQSTYSILVTMCGVLIVRRLVAAIGAPSPATMQLAVKQSLLSMILLDAFVAYWWMGPYWGAGISLLILPALWLGARFRTT
jgi:4-hydroxybenzoate polyprenyltransferase